MAFENLDARLASTGDAAQIMTRFQAVYDALKTLDAMVTRYTNGSDPVYTTALDTLLSTEEINVLATMVQGTRGLQHAWENDAAIREALGLPPL